MLVTGTHDSTPDVVNTLYHRGGVLRADTWQRLPGSFHGSGCTLASALAANLARGLDIADAVYEAQDYTWQALAKAYRPGMGQYIPDRLFWARENAAEDDDELSRGWRGGCAGSTRSLPEHRTPQRSSRAWCARARRRRRAGAVPRQAGTTPALALEQARAPARRFAASSARPSS